MAPSLKWKRPKSQQPDAPAPTTIYTFDHNNNSFSTTENADTDTTITKTLTVTMTIPKSKNKDKNKKQPTPTPVAPAVAQALAIPEIILCIAVFLRRPTLAQCAQVCKHWHTLFQPLLFRHIYSADFDRPSFVHAFENHAQFTTSIDWIQFPIPPPPPKKQPWRRIFRRKELPPPTEKTFLELEKRLISAGHTPALETLSVRILNQDPNLVLRLPANSVLNLKISIRGYPPKKPKIYIEDILVSYPHLVNLVLEGLYILTTRQPYDIVDQPQTPKPDPVPPRPTMLMLQGNVYHHRNNEDTLVNSLAGVSLDQSTSVSGSSTLAGSGTESGAGVGSSSGSGSGSGTSTNTSTDMGTDMGSGTDAATTAVETVQPNNTISTFDWNIYQEKLKKTGKKKTSSIRALEIRLVDISQDDLLDLSEYFPRLESILIEEFLVPDMMIKIYRWEWSTEFIHSFKMSYPHLRIIRFAIPFDVIKEDTIVEILKSFPQLTTVGFRNSCFGQRALKTMQEHCKNVDCLDISFGFSSREFKKDLLRFLQSNTKLREFEADGMIFHLDRAPTAEEENLDSEELYSNGPRRMPRRHPIALNWACTNLVKLVCGFQGTDSAIFRFLSGFPLLECLTVTCPSLNLSPVKSTLGWLARSNQIKYFWFSHYRHLPMEKNSIDWMIAHWPNLRTLHVAGGGATQREAIQQMFKDAQRYSVHIEHDSL
ncbi:hypothetical protein BGZ94_006164 [Podila epigama]|nr:hypothetical protein BGZ94_006164 [Podila epigama]